MFFAANHSKFGEQDDFPLSSNQHRQHSQHASVQMPSFGRGRGDEGRATASEFQDGQQEMPIPSAVEKQELDDALRNMRHFKPVVFRIERFDGHAEVTLLFAICKSENMMEASGTFYIPLNSDRFEPAGFMLKKEDRPPVHKQMDKFIEMVPTATGRSEEKGSLPKDNVNVIVQTVEVCDVEHNLPANRPISLMIEGVSSKFSQSHRFSYSTNPSSGVIMRGGGTKVMYSSRSTPSMLEGFHGTVDCVKKSATDYSSWGRFENGEYRVPIMSEKAVFLCYNLYDLLCLFRKEKDHAGRLPKYLREEVFDELEQCYLHHKSAKENNGVATNLYGIDTDLTDGYMGFVIDILNKNGPRGSAWTQAPNELHINIPEEAIRFFAGRYDSHIDGIVLTAPGSIKVKAEYVNEQDKEVVADPAKHHIFFTVKAKVFVPRMYYFIKNIE